MAKGTWWWMKLPLGMFGEIEGPARWIDKTAGTLGIRQADYINQAYTELFFAWKKSSRSQAKDMTFTSVRQKK